MSLLKQVHLERAYNVRERDTHTDIESNKLTRCFCFSLLLCPIFQRYLLGALQSKKASQQCLDLVLGHVLGDICTYIEFPTKKKRKKEKPTPT